VTLLSRIDTLMFSWMYYTIVAAVSLFLAFAFTLPSLRPWLTTNSDKFETGSALLLIQIMGQMQLRETWLHEGFVSN
jgi:hypothetical protein